MSRYCSSGSGGRAVGQACPKVGPLGKCGLFSNLLWPTVC